jgi:pSer/pThr/pTyr-binding forkhead associated (FHA) protein
MLDIFITYPTPEGSREIAIEGERTSFGRSDEADYRLDDEGLSRLHATVYRDGDRIWMVDENSTNGSFVNGARVGGSGTVLKNGDQIKIGNHTKMIVRIADGKTSAQPSQVQSQPANTNIASVSSSPPSSSMLIPILVTMCALFVIGISAIFIGVKVVGGNSEIVYKPNDTDKMPADRADFWKIIKDTKQREQVVKFFAAGIVAENPQKFNLKKERPLFELYKTMVGK